MFIEASTPIRTAIKSYTRDNLSLHYGNQCITVSYTVSKDHKAPDNNVRLDVYTISGRLVKTLVDEPGQIGEHNVNWHVADQSNGIYIFKLRGGGNITVKRQMLFK